MPARTRRQEELMDPYTYGVTKLHELREERLATLTVTCSQCA